MKIMVSIPILLLFLQAVVATPEIAWRFSSDSCLSPPCVYEMLVFTGSDEGRLFAIYAHSGKIRWSKQMDGKILASAACEGRVFVSTSEGIVCLSADHGDLLWRFEMKDPGRRALVVGGNSIFIISHEGYVVSLGFDGILRWEENLNEIVVTQPILLGDSLVIATFGGNLVFLDISNGAWRKTISIGRFCPVIFDFTIEENVAYLCSDNSLFAVSTNSGEVLWMRDLGCVTKPLVFKEGICVGTSKGLVFLNKETGETIWSTETKGKPFFVISETETLLVGTRTGFKNYDANGNLIWEMNVGAAIYPPVLLYGKIFALVSQKEILCIGSWGEVGETGKGMGYVYLAIAVACSFLFVLLDVLLPEKRIIRKKRVVKKAKCGKRKSGGVAGI